MVRCTCGKTARYGFMPRIPLACRDCKDTCMVNVETPRCEHGSCKKSPAYGFPEEEQRIKRFCKTHSLPGMINLCVKKCRRNKCHGEAVYGYPQLGLREFCLKHSSIHMVNMKRT